MPNRRAHTKRGDNTLLRTCCGPFGDSATPRGSGGVRTRRPASGPRFWPQLRLTTTTTPSLRKTSARWWAFSAPTDFKEHYPPYKRHRHYTTSPLSIDLLFYGIVPAGLLAAAVLDLANGNKRGDGAFDSCTADGKFFDEKWHSATGIF